MSQEKKVVFEIRELDLMIKGEHPQTISYGSFDICLGDFILIKGPNGSGKSTLFQALYLTDANYYTTRKGSIRYKLGNAPDVDLHAYKDEQMDSLHQSIVYIGQYEEFGSFSSAYDALRTPASTVVKAKYKRKARRKGYKKIDKRIEYYFEKYLKKIFNVEKLWELRLKKATSYSGGQQKMLNVLSGLIKAEICHCPLIILDEPLNNLDVKNKRVVNEVLSNFIKDRYALLMITHCQIFNGINKKLDLSVDDQTGDVTATLSDGSVHAYTECLK